METVIFTSSGYTFSSQYGAWNPVGVTKEETYMYSYPTSDSTGGYIGTQTGVDLTNYNIVYFDIELGNETKTYSVNVSDLSDSHYIAISYRMNDQVWMLGFHITSGIGDLRLITEKATYENSITSNHPLKIRKIYMK